MSAPILTKVSLELAPCHTEVDVTIVDRIQALLNPQPLAGGGAGGGAMGQMGGASIYVSAYRSFNAPGCLVRILVHLCY